MVHRAGMVDSMAIVGNIRPAAPPGVWQPSAAPLASAGAPSVVYDADTTDEFDYISRRGKDGLRTITTTSGGQTTTFTAGPGLEQKRGRGWVGTDVMPSPADVEQGLLYRALHPPLPTTSPSTSPAPPNHHPTSFSNDIESIGNDHSTASRPASSASSAAGGGGGFAYGARPMKWAASTNAPLELHDRGARGGRDDPYDVINDQEQDLLDCRETISILQIKVEKLEQLLQLKDRKIDDMAQRLEGGGGGPRATRGYR